MIFSSRNRCTNSRRLRFATHHEPEPAVPTVCIRKMITAHKKTSRDLWSRLRSQREKSTTQIETVAPSLLQILVDDCFGIFEHDFDPTLHERVG